jgi:hypothetical protein
MQWMRRAPAATTECETAAGTIRAEAFFVDLGDVTLFAYEQVF